MTESESCPRICIQVRVAVMGPDAGGADGPRAPQGDRAATAVRDQPAGMRSEPPWEPGHAGPGGPGRRAAAAREPEQTRREAPNFAGDKRPDGEPSSHLRTGLLLVVPMEVV